MASIIMATPIGITNTPERESSNRLSFSDDENEGRAFVASYSQKPKFAPWDKIMLVVRGANGAETVTGPYYIETVVSPNKYTLCDEQGKSIRGGTSVSEDELRMFGK
ncbi:uncharacterized protein BO96DRAFT_500131 [Aspergillus niger CBS 101883]|uniref:uncharacterized protein n=1 Tax=Aspergillus lacticoffeatus (strain CBS 101883) TaxID=1450533 RepID=UPI000D7F5D33|nr:uncharacterized protein BO96DRAFT_500131 [Aspergillus niger CBS 101883]PYH56987.1 hypothetical protein BO96DRAFT_500131 [Aspergillus niger CBS 101883]